MTEQTSGFLAKKLRQNWLNRFPSKPVALDDEQDDSLTNLNWLQNINLTRFTNAEDLLSPSPVTATNGHMSPIPVTLANRTNLPLRNHSPSVSGDTNNSNRVIDCSTDDYLSSDVKFTYTQSPAFAQAYQDQNGHKKQYLNLYSTGGGHARPSMLMSNSRQRLTSIHQQPRNGHINYNPTIMSSYSQQPHHNHHHNHNHHHQTPITLSQPLGFIPTTLVHIDGRQPGSTIAAFNLPTQEHNSPPGCVKVLSAETMKLPASLARPHQKSQYNKETTSPNDSNVQEKYANCQLLEPVLSVFHGDSRLNCPVDQSGHPVPSYVYPKLITRPGNSTLLTLPASGMVTATDTIDISSSGLFTTIDCIEETIRQQYQTMSHLVPCFSRQQLIYMCMQDLRRNKITVDDIKVWVMENFAYYRTLQTNWQDGFRETMVVSRCFQRVPRRKEEPGGKGDLWRLNPEFQSQIANNRISSKFLSAWQTEVPYVTNPPPEKKEVQYSRRITVDATTVNSSNSHLSNKQSPLFDNLTTVPDVQELSAKRRCVNSISDLSQISLTSNVYDVSSCSVSSSSPPLSDLCTPPPQCLSDNHELSPLQNPPLTLSSRTDLLKYGRISAADQNDSFCVVPDGRIHPDVFIPPDFVGTSDLRGHVNDKCAFPESDTIAELSQACGLNEIPTLDLDNIPDPLDLTIRGVSLKPPSDWWNNDLSDSLSLLFNNNNNNSRPSSSPNNCHELDDLRETFHLVNGQVDDKDQPYPIVHQSLPSGEGLAPVCPDNLENNPKPENSQQDQLCQTNAENSAGAQQDIENDLTLNASRSSGQSNPIPYTQYPFLTENHLELGEESNWMDEQLNLEELNSFLGLA